MRRCHLETVLDTARLEHRIGNSSRINGSNSIVTICHARAGRGWNLVLKSSINIRNWKPRPKIVASSHPGMPRRRFIIKLNLGLLFGIGRGTWHLTENGSESSLSNCQVRTSRLLKINWNPQTNATTIFVFILRFVVLELPTVTTSEPAFNG
jgi:hypothetical protein